MGTTQRGLFNLFLEITLSDIYQYSNFSFNNNKQFSDTKANQSFSFNNGKSKGKLKLRETLDFENSSMTSYM